jgi:hypothetical protein
VAGDGFVKVLVIPEDPTLDQYILKPVVNRLFADLGRTARIDILSNPRLRGVDQELSQAVLSGIALPVCPELQELRERIRGWLESRS